MKACTMKQKISIFIVLGIILGLAVYGYFKAVSAPVNQTENRPQITIAPQSFDFGEVDYGEVAEYTFRVTNLGDEALEIKRVATSCACTEALISKEKISPEEEVELKVTYNTGAMSGTHSKGKQERIIYVKSNDPVNPQVEVTINADVK